MTAPAGIEINFSGNAEDAEWDAAAPTTASPVTLVPTPPALPAGTTAPTPTPTNTGPRQNGLPMFEGAPVARTEIKLSGSASINTNDGISVTMDDRIRVVGQFRVTKVTHYADKNGDIVRVQYVTPIDDLELCPWDPADPTDDGIVRVRPVKP